MADHPTPDEIMKVRRWECEGTGHRWDIVEEVGRGPVMVLCGNCGDSFNVVNPHATRESSPDAVDEPPS